MESQVVCVPKTFYIGYDKKWSTEVSREWGTAKIEAG